MKRLLFLLCIVSVGFSQTRTSNWYLPQWGTGDTLKAGTKNTTPLSNFSLNNGFARIDAIAGAGIDSSGYFRHIRGSSGLDLNINADYASGTVRRVVIQDSLYGTYNWQTTGNLLVGGNAFIGGYITTDSVISGLVLTDSIVSENPVNIKGGITVGSYDGNINGAIVFANNADQTYTQTLQANNNGLANSYTNTMPSADGTLAVDGTDTTAFSGSNTRLAVYRSGVTVYSKITASIRGLDAGNGSESLPVAGDLLKVVVKSDSIIFLRAAGTTSGLKLTYTWLK